MVEPVALPLLSCMVLDAAMRTRNLLLAIFILVAAPFCVIRCSNPASQAQHHEILNTIADVPLPGPAVRFDYQSLDVTDGRLYIALSSSTPRSAKW
jgi:hypothetical protein